MPPDEIVEIDYSELDPGICYVVQWLREAGFNTSDSGDGVSKLIDPVAEARKASKPISQCDPFEAANRIAVRDLADRGVRFQPVVPEGVLDFPHAFITQRFKHITGWALGPSRTRTG